MHAPPFARIVSFSDSIFAASDLSITSESPVTAITVRIRISWPIDLDQPNCHTCRRLSRSKGFLFRSSWSPTHPPSQLVPEDSAFSELSIGVFSLSSHTVFHCRLRTQPITHSRLWFGNSIARPSSLSTPANLKLTEHPVVVFIYLFRPLVSLVNCESIATLNFPTNRGQSYCDTTRPSPFQSKLSCEYYKRNRHWVLICPVTKCYNCYQIGPKHFFGHCPKKKRKNSQQLFVADNTDTMVVFSTSTSLTVDDLKSLLHQLQQKCGNPFVFALSNTLGRLSWYFDYVCCSHMTIDSTIFSSKCTSSNLPIIKIANESIMYVSHSNYVTLPNLSVSHTFFILISLSIFLSIGQLCNFGFYVLFIAFGYYIQDSKIS